MTNVTPDTQSSRPGPHRPVLAPSTAAGIRARQGQGARHPPGRGARAPRGPEPAAPAAAVRARARVPPRGGADRIDGVGPGGELRVRVRAAPADGEANVALRRVLAASLEVPPSVVTLEAGGPPPGQTGRGGRGARAG